MKRRAFVQTVMSECFANKIHKEKCTIVRNAHIHCKIMTQIKTLHIRTYIHNNTTQIANNNKKKCCLHVLLVKCIAKNRKREGEPNMQREERCL